MLTQLLTIDLDGRSLFRGLVICRLGPPLGPNELGDVQLEQGGRLLQTPIGNLLGGLERHRLEFGAGRLTLGLGVTVCWEARARPAGPDRPSWVQLTRRPGYGAAPLACDADITPIADLLSEPQIAYLYDLSEALGQTGREA